MKRTNKDMMFDLLVIGVLASIPIGSFVLINGFSIIPVITELNISPSFFLTNLYYSWHPYYGGGFDNSSSSWFIFPLGLLFAVLNNIGVEISIISIFFMFIVYYLHGISMYYLTCVLGKIESALPRSARIMASSLYIFNPFTLLYMHELGSQQLLTSAILPLLIAFLLQGLHKKNLSYCIYIGLLSILAGANVTFFVISILLLLAYALYDLIVEHGADFLWKAIFATTMLTAILASNIFWLLPRLSNLTAEINAAFQGGESISLSVVLNSLSSSYYDTFRLMGSWAFQPSYFSYYQQYYSPLILTATFATPILAITSLVLKPKRKFEIFAAVMILVSVPLAVAAYPPSNPHLTGRIYLWLYQNAPFFIIFRGAYKFVMIIALSYSALLGLAWAKIVERNYLKKSKGLLTVVAIIIIGFLLLGSSPSFYGLLVERKTSFNVPQYYYEAANWLNSMGNDFRIFTIPEMRHVQYVWDGEVKFAGTDVSVPIFKIPIVGRSYFLPLGSTDELAHQLYRMTIANQTENLAHALKILNVRYVMIHGDYKWDALEWNRSPSYLLEILKSAPNIMLVKSFGELYFFENQLWSDLTFFKVNSPSNSSSSVFTFDASTFEPETNETTSNWRIEDDMFVSDALHSYNDDILLSKKAYTDLALAFEAKSSNGYLHIYFFALNEKNSYRLWLNDTHYELGKLVEGKFAPIITQNHTFSLNISTWNSYEVEVNEGKTQLSINGNRINITYEDRNYIAGKIGFASVTNIVWIRNVTLECQLFEVNLTNIHPCSYVSISPTKYVAQLQNVSDPLALVFTNSFHEGWNAYIDENTTVKIEHKKLFNYANGWYINQTGDFTVTLEFVPQRAYVLSLELWLLILAGFIAFSIYAYNKTHPILNKIKNMFGS